METFLEGRKMSKFFGGVAAVQSVDFEVREGEIFGLIGPNGAGKTTLFNLISGALRPSSGQALFRGKVISGLPYHRVVAEGLARTHQVVRPFRNLTVSQNIQVALFNGRRPPKTSAAGTKETTEIANSCGLESSLLDHSAGSLSIGQLKRLEIARALATRPEVLLCDEICGGLNPNETSATLALLREIRDQGKTVVYVEHNMRAVMSICDRIMVLNFGRKIAEGSPEVIAQNPDVIEAYLGRTEPTKTTRSTKIR